MLELRQPVNATPRSMGSWGAWCKFYRGASNAKNVRALALIVVREVVEFGSFAHIYAELLPTTRLRKLQNRPPRCLSSSARWVLAWVGFCVAMPSRDRISSGV